MHRISALAALSLGFSSIACVDDATVLHLVNLNLYEAGKGGANAGSTGGTTDAGGIGADSSVTSSGGSAGSGGAGGSGGVATGGTANDGGAGKAADGGRDASDGASAVDCPVGSILSDGVCLDAFTDSLDYGFVRCEVKSNSTLWCWGQGLEWNFATWQEARFPTQVGSDSDWRSVSVGIRDICGIRGIGSLYRFGQIYTGSGPLGGWEIRNSPTLVGTDTDWASVSTGSSRTCAVKKDGTLWCWGILYVDPTDGGSLVQTTPKQVGTDVDWAFAVVGEDHACALKTDGSLECFGHNEGGELGDGTTTTRVAPAPILEEGPWTSVAMGFTTCGLKANGTVWCWGGSLGPIPVRSGTNSDFTQLAGHIYDICALRKGGSIHCLDRTTAEMTLLDGSSGYRELAAGGCARHEDGTLRCWGNQPVGDGRGAVIMTPVRVGSDSDWASLELQWQRSIGLHTDGRLDAFGAPAEALGPWLEVTSDGTNVCGVRANHTLWCWGQYYGTNDTAHPAGWLVPVQAGSATDWLHVESTTWGAFGGFTCGIRASGGGNVGTLWCAWPSYDPSWFQVGTAADWKTIAGNDDTLCGTRQDGSLWCLTMSLGPGPSGPFGPVPNLSQIGTDTDWTSVAVGDDYQCGIKNGGELWCWGTNTFGGLGDGTRQNSSAPVHVQPGTTWQTVSAGWGWTCGIRTDRSLWCWGDDRFGQLGLGPPGAGHLVPEQVGTFTDWSAVSTSTGADPLSCGVRNGELYCWGENAIGLVTRNDPQAKTLVPVVEGAPSQYPFCAFPRDDDHDGYAGCLGDCDNTNPDVYPGHAELCNGFDDNCDQVVDEGCP